MSQTVITEIRSTFFRLICFVLTALPVLACTSHNRLPEKTNQEPMQSEVKKSTEEWKKELTPMQFSVLREKATERPFTGLYDKFYETGIYYCAGCGAELFASNTKFNSGCGWPSFYDPSKPHHILEVTDTSHGMIRTEIVCASCGGHLGHVFDDGPEPTGKRYCVNSASLVFKRKP